MKIHILPSEVIDQIAAGEVVERPSHMIKELVENSLDAGATSIHVEWSLGGRDVRIVDNGKGMSPEDLPLSIERHATSKISVSDDLWNLSSFGFRGEALASIAAVSQLTITSRMKDSEQAYQLYCEFGKRNPIEKVSGQIGTILRVENLFQNTPARLKFLKTDSAESSQIKNTLKALALANPHVEFRGQENGKLVFFYGISKSRKDRVEQVLEVKPLYESSAVRDSVKSFAVYADPHQVAKTTKNIWLFAQNRWIQDRSLQVACMEAYRNLLMHGEYPICVVWVETEPDRIDVNIHPTKSQVKFQDPSLAFRAVQGALRSGLEQAPWIQSDVRLNITNSFPDVTNAGFASVGQINKTESNHFEQKELFAKSDDRTQLRQKTYNASVVSYTPNENIKYSEELKKLNVNSFAVSDVEIKSIPISENEIQIHQKEIARVNLNSNNHIDEVSSGQGYWSSLHIVGQAHLTYIVCQSGTSMILVDQHAAHERVAFEKLMSAWRGGKIDIQDFLFPLAVDMSPEKVEAIQTVFADLERLGLHMELLGPSTVGVKAAPLLLKESVLPDVFEKMATEILEYGGSFSMEKVIGDVCATMACHSVVRAGQALSHEEMKSLLNGMDQFPLSSFCPHGRPVSVQYPFMKIEKDFGRIV